MCSRQACIAIESDSTACARERNTFMATETEMSAQCANMPTFKFVEFNLFTFVRMTTE